MKPMVVIVGSQRSGTSLIAQALTRLGVSFGSPLVPPDSGNVRGYYEHVDITREQNLMLHLCYDARDWEEPKPLTFLGGLHGTQERRDRMEKMAELIDSERGECKQFGLKCLYYTRIPDVWGALLQTDTVFIHAMRYPSAAFESLIRENQTDHTPSRSHTFYRIWAWNQAECFKLNPAAEIWYDDWFREPEVNMKKLAEAIGQPPASTEGLLL